MHDCASGQEEQRLEERVREDVVASAEGGADAETEEHIAQLRNR